MNGKPRLAVFKFASCDGCQLSLLSAEDQLLEFAGKVEIAHFLEATSRIQDGPYDVALVEGSVTTPHDVQRILEIRRQSEYLITIGACATAGGIQSLRNWADHSEFLQAVYASPEYISSLDRSTPIAAHVRVDFELRGCPINQYQLIEVLCAVLAGRQPRVPRHTVCLDCKLRGTVCVMVAQGQPCLGPVTHTGCNAICPSYNRGCYGCYGPAAQPNLISLTTEFGATGVPREQVVRSLRSFNGYADEFRKESERLAEGGTSNATEAGS